MDLKKSDIPAEVRSWMGKQLFEQVPNNIVVIDRDFKVVIANENFKKVFGDPDGRHCFEVYKGRTSVCEKCMAARTFEDGRVRVTDEMGIDKSGKPAHYVVHNAPMFNESGGVAYVIEMSYDVTETRSLQKEYNILFERVPCYVSVINRDLKIVRANELLRKTFGETTGEYCYEVYKDRTERCTDCPAMKTFADGGSYSSRHTGVNKNGETTHYVVSTAPLSRSGGEFSHVIEMSADVTDVHRLSEELAKEERFRRILIDNTLDALIAVDETGKVNIFNHAAERLFKVSRDDVIGKSRGRRFAPREFLDAIGEGGSSLSLPETTIKDSEGETIPVRFTGAILRDQDTVIGGAAFFQDLRQIKQLEKDKLDNERLAAVGQTVAQLAHGIKNILTGLQGGMYVIKSGQKSGSTEKTEKGWKMLDRNVERITDLVKGFLSFSKGHTPEVQSVDPVSIASEVFNLYQDAAAQQNVTLRFQAQEDIADAYMDPEDIHTCLANLISNAIDACQTSDGNTCSVTLSVREKDQTIVYEVVDTGCGMEYDIKNKVFTTFFTTKGLGGTGLGLMVTRKIVQEHGGRITVDSVPGEGSSFRIEFNRERLPQPEGQQKGEG